MSIREMARRVGVSPSFISQVELGKTTPSIGTLYAIASELRLSLDSLMNEAAEPEFAEAAEVASRDLAAAPTPTAADKEPVAVVAADLLRAHGPLPVSGDRPRAMSDMSGGRSGSSMVQRAHERPSINIGNVTWERLTTQDDPTTEFLRITYPPGSESCAPDNLMHHNGWEYGHILAGKLDVQVSFQTETMESGDSIDFDSTRPHRLSNPFATPCVGIWIVVGRQSRRSS